MRLAIAILSTAAWLAAADLAGVKAEPDLERRSEFALANADKALDEARKALDQGQETELKTAIDEVHQSLVLSKESLVQSGKNARRNPKYFKKAEIGIRKLIRRLETFKLEVHVDEREPVEKLITRAHELQDEIMLMVFKKKK
ncbi:MAG: hypothetical protein FJW39_04740 [Acidobacteria bacterium]|nr:hypothetical protein [Acidobacteriota bacterium]